MKLIWSGSQDDRDGWASADGAALEAHREDPKASFFVYSPAVESYGCVYTGTLEEMLLELDKVAEEKGRQIIRDRVDFTSLGCFTSVAYVIRGDEEESK